MLENLSLTELKRLARYYNLHTKIANVAKLSKDEILNKLKKHIYVDGDNFFIVQNEYQILEAIKTKKQLEKINNPKPKKQKTKTKTKEVEENTTNKVIDPYILNGMKAIDEKMKGVPKEHYYTALKTSFPVWRQMYLSAQFKQNQMTMNKIEEFLKKYSISINDVLK